MNRFHHQAQALMSWCLANVCRPFSSPPLQNSNYKSQLQRHERWRQQCIEGFQQPPPRHNCPTSPGNSPSARPFLPTSLPLCVCLPAPENIPLSGLAENDVWGGGGGNNTPPPVCILTNIPSNYLAAPFDRPS